MNRFLYYAEITSISGILALIKTMFGDIHTSYIILLVLIAIDTFTGMSVAMKYHRFNSKGLCKLIKKMITYSIAIFTIKLLEVGILNLIDTTIVSQVMVAFLQITEAVSILENLTLLGVPLPSNFINFLLKNIKIPGLSDALKWGRKGQREISEIDDIINYQIPTFDDKNVRELLEIKFKFWKAIAFHIKTILEDKDTPPSQDHLYFKIMSLMEVELKDMNEELYQSDIPNDYIEVFEAKYRPLVDDFLMYLQDVCSSNCSGVEIKSKIIDKIIVLSYETILNTHKIFSNKIKIKK